VDAAHQLRLVLREVVVDGDDVNALAREGVQVARQRCDERLPLAGLHLGHVALVECRPAHDLHVEVALAERPLRRLAHRRKGFRQEVVQAFTLGQPLLEGGGLVAQLVVGEPFEVLLERVDLRRDALQPLEDPALAGTQQLLEDLGHAQLLLTDD
jgi:hypothetical protein